jgi:hypothetical protein
MNLIVSHVLTFVGGVVAKWVQGLLQDRKKQWQEIKSDILRPIRSQLHTAIPELEAKPRVTTVDLPLWNRIVASGRDQEMPRELCEAIAQLYNVNLPEHDRAWQAAYAEMVRVMELADQNFGKVLTVRDLPQTPWWDFVTTETLQLDLLREFDQAPIRIWNRELDNWKLRPLNDSRREFFRRVWTEARGCSVILAYVSARRSSLASTRHCLELLDAAINSGVLSRLPEPLKKIPL